MTAGNKTCNYIVITPVKDEEKYVEATILSVIAQTVRPTKWLIVDDDSSDQTPDIVLRFAKQYEWITYLPTVRGKKRELGSAEIRAFSRGYESLQSDDFAFVVKLDADLKLSPDHFERMLEHFSLDPRLGIASGVYLEEHGGKWAPIKMPAYHAAGAAKMVRRECFDDIGGFALLPGWDTVDEIKAQAKGWSTAHFPEIEFFHLKPEGSAKGWLTNKFHGEIYYVCGGGKVFFALKVLERMLFGKPFFVSGLLLLYGYLVAAVSGRKRLIDDNEARIYKGLQNKRLTDFVSGRVNLGSRPQ